MGISTSLFFAHVRDTLPTPVFSSFLCTVLRQMR